MRPYEFSRDKYGSRLLADVLRFETSWGLIGDEAYQLLYHETIFVTSGEITVDLDDQRFVLRPRWVCHAPPGTVRRVARQRAGRAVILLVDPELATDFLADGRARARLGMLSDGRPRAGALPRRAFHRLIAGVRDVEAELGRLRTDSALVLHANTCATLLALTRELADAGHEGGAPHARRALVTRFQALVARDFAARHRVDDYCRELGTTRKTLALACGREAQATPHELIRRRVLLEARRLLAFTELSVGQVASQLGFTDGAHFARVFRAAEHRTPRAFRDGR